MPTNARLTRAQCSTLLKTPSLRVVFNSLGTIKFIKNTDNKGISVIISSKLIKKAVIRNKMRRRLYTIFCNFYKNKDIQPISGMIYVSRHSVLMSFEELERNFNDLLKKTQKNT